MAKETKKGIVYIVQNSAFPHLFKIGYTEMSTIEGRKLNASNVPEDFEILFGYECNNPKEIEEHLHDICKGFRHYSKTGRKTEFFYIGCLSLAKKALELYEKKGAKDISDDIVLEKDNKIEYDEAKNIERVTKKKSPPFTFNEVNIKPGTTLVFTKDERKECKVKNDKKVLYRKQEYYLSTLAKEFMGKTDRDSLQGPRYFKVKGEKKTLLEKRWEMGDSNS